MKNKTLRNAIGGLALLASTAIGQGVVTNAPVITKISTEIRQGFPDRKYVTLSATNLSQNVRYYIQEKESLTNSVWKTRTSNLYNTSDDLNTEKSATFYYPSQDTNLQKRAFFRLTTK